MRKRSLIIAAILVVFSIACFVLWNRLLPVVPFDDSDLRVELAVIPAQSNGFHLLLKAAEALDLSEQEATPLRNLSTGSNWNASVATNLLDANREAIQLTRAARAQPIFQIDGVFT